MRERESKKGGRRHKFRRRMFSGTKNGNRNARPHEVRRSSRTVIYSDDKTARHSFRVNKQGESSLGSQRLRRGITPSGRTSRRQTLPPPRSWLVGNNRLGVGCRQLLPKTSQNQKSSVRQRHEVLDTPGRVASLCPRARTFQQTFCERPENISAPWMLKPVPHFKARQRWCDS